MPALPQQPADRTDDADPDEDLGAPPPAPAWAARRDLAVRAAVREGLLDEDTPLAAFVDLAGIAETAAALRRAWPEGLDVRHAFAAKANSLVPVLRVLRGHGFGCEVASAGELAQALTAGFAPEELVFDSPAKSRAEIEAALAAGIALNADSFQELDRIDEYMARQNAGGTQGSTNAPDARNPAPHGAIGIRINPQIGIGGIEAMSTAGEHSKFGVPLRDPGNRERLLAAYLKRPWLNWIHVHVGSQGMPAKLIGAGVAAVVELATEINELCGERRVLGIDIGGGLTVDFTGEQAPDFAGHARAVLAAAPELERGEFRILTEFGRSIMAKNGFMASRVEYTKLAGGRNVAITHLGAHVAARTAFAPASWPLRVLAYDAQGLPSTERVRPQDIAGPCCFAGDMVAREYPLPKLAQGDVAVVPDTGAYYFSTPFRYNSLPMPAVYGFEVDDAGVPGGTADASAVRFTLLRRAESVADVVAESLGDLWRIPAKA
jgi:diaminopimelate decarboxylase